MYTKWKRKTEMLNLQRIQTLLEQGLSSSQVDGLSPDDISELLKGPEDRLQDLMSGYPGRPLYRQLAYRLYSWISTRSCPLMELHTFHLLDEKPFEERRLLTTSEVEELIDELINSQDNDQIQVMKRILEKLTKRGLLDLLGLRHTVGSVDIWPPSRQQLEVTFNTPNKPSSGSCLSSGARALAKHCHRDQTTRWWGNCTGTEAAKNAQALDVMKRILDDAQWINIHLLPHNLCVIEVRQRHGYGLRWTADGSGFRGFLEPQMEDGHDIGWRH